MNAPHPPGSTALAPARSAGTETAVLSTPGPVDLAWPPPAVDIPHDCVPAPPDTSAPAPQRSAARLIGVDVARGVALLGMMAVHIFDPATDDGNMSLPWILSSGKSAALFAVVAGVGIAFMTGRERRPGGRRLVAAGVSLVVRALLIGAIGLLVGPLVNYDDARVILPFYAVLFVLAIPLLRLSPRALAVLALLAAVFIPVVSHLLRGDLPVPPLANPTFAELVADPAAELVRLSLTGVYPALPWVAYLALGMAVGRSRLSSRGVVIRMTFAGLVLAVAAAGASWFAMVQLGGRAALEPVALATMPLEQYTDLMVWGGDGTLPTTSPWWLGVMAPHTTTPVDLLFTMGVSLAVIGLAILLGRVAWAPLAPLAKAGSMTLTLYVAHLLLLGAGFMPENEGLDYAVQVVGFVVFAMLWAKWLGRGPLEAVVWWATRLTRNLVLGRGRGDGAPSGGGPTGTGSRGAVRRGRLARPPMHARPRKAHLAGVPAGVPSAAAPPAAVSFAAGTETRRPTTSG
ncbi:DUF1624 domain-containing protein [Georgenia yuyongxinii]|uniref:DUF1624 domain-containing protein n=1 Tax=Georgenia yuyongxinii TaxID=2589797 RepID=A0A5B8C5H3_9MICO|nr:heparan-alpha-glucosaminide N-acetyltransferase domain-containing protein [Georgenia yuyongxinii]QDC24605.1 DUF1624 domain-containing protein [Georgenia yuyongxinii]